MLGALQTETRYAARRLARSPGFVAAVVLSLAAGIAADVTMLGIVDSLLFRPPAHVRDIDRVADVRVRTYPDYADLRDQAKSFSAVAAWFAPPRPYVISDGSATFPAQQMLASASLFPLAGVRPVIGRFYSPEEDRPGGPHVAVLGYALWQRRFGGSTAVLGKTVHVAGDSYTLIGVAPPGFTGVALANVDVFLPITTTKFDAPSTALTSRNYTWLHVVARLAPEVTMRQAQAEAKLIYARGNPGDTATSWQIAALGGRPADVHPIMEFRRESAAANVPVSLWLAGVATIVLLIACANVVGLQLARGARARRETALRAALGASRRRLVAGLLLESMILAGLAAAAALALAYWADGVIRAVVLTDVAAAPSSFDVRRLALALGVAGVTVAICGILPALPLLRGGLAREVVNGARSVAPAQARTRRALLAAQLALAMVLVVGAALFVASFHNARALDLGMSLDQVLVADINVQGAGYSTERAHAMIDPVLQQLRAIPGVQAAALSDADMSPGWITFGVSVPGRDSATDAHTAAGQPHAFSAVTPDFFATVGTPIIAGRTFTNADRGRRVVIVSDAFARLYWPGENALGRCVRLFTSTEPCAEVVGVSRDRRMAPGDTARLVELFAPLGSPAEPAWMQKNLPLSSVALRVAGDATAPMRDAQRVLQSAFPDVASIRVRPALSMFDRAVRAWRLGATMFTVFGVIALGLGVFGVYASMAYLVAQRTRELGIRMALGATAGDVARLVLAEVVRVAIAGGVFGVLASALMARGIRVFLFGISPAAPAAYAGAVVLLATAAVSASFVPMRRAARLDPAATLRSD